MTTITNREQLVRHQPSGELYALLYTPRNDQLRGVAGPLHRRDVLDADDAVLTDWTEGHFGYDDDPDEIAWANDQQWTLLSSVES